jgi:putative endonuclease
MAGDHRQELGKFGETRACEELARRGYAVLARRYRTRAGEIDIVARDGPTIVFVEVKARTSERFGGGAAAITPMKQRRIAHMASDFLARHRLDGQPCRFDVVVVDVAAHDVRVEVIRDAFGAG